MTSEEVPPMSSSELDLSVAPSSEQIRKREFATVRRGYDADQVRDYLRQVAEQIAKLEQESLDAKATASAAETSAADSNAALLAALDRARAAEHDAREANERADVAAAAPTGDPYAAFGERMGEMLRSAESEAAEIKTAAEMESRRVEMEARAEADRITTDAQSRAEELRSGAAQVMDRSQEEADRMLAGLYSKKEALKADLEHMRERLLAMAESLEALAGAAPAPETSPIEFIEVPDAVGEPAAPAAELASKVFDGNADPTHFSKEELKEVWEDDTGLLPERGLADQIDETMAAAAMDAPSAPAAPPPVPAADPGVASPFFVDETTRADEDPGTPGLYPR